MSTFPFTKAEAAALQAYQQRIDAEVLPLCEEFGFGAVMQTASQLWLRRDPIGAKTVGPCAGAGTINDEVERKILLGLRGFITTQGLKLKGAKLVREIDAYLATRLHDIAMDSARRAD